MHPSAPLGINKFSAKAQIANILGFAGHIVFSAMHNEGVWVCPKNILTETDGRVGLNPGQ